MEDGQGKLVVQVLTTAVLVLLVAGTPASAQPATVTGTMTVNGREYPLRHVYASAQPGFFDKTSEDVRVLLTDVPVDETARADIFALLRLSRNGQLHAIEVLLDASGKPLTGSLFVDAFNGMASVAGMHQFERKALERKLIAGRIFTDGPRTFDTITWQYDATFSAPIPRPPTAEETAAALNSPPGVAARAHVQAILTGFDAFIGTLTEASAASYRAPGGKERFEEVRDEMPPDSRVVSLTEGPDGTYVATVQGKRRDGVIIEFSVKVLREGPGWRIDRR